MTICYPLSTGKWLQNELPWMTLSGYFMTKCVFGLHFLNKSVWMSEIVQPLCDSAVFCALHDQLASLGRHAQLTRCFSAVAELLVFTWIFAVLLLRMALYRNFDGKASSETWWPVSVSNLVRIGSEIDFKMTSAAILDFCNMWILMATLALGSQFQLLH